MGKLVSDGRQLTEVQLDISYLFQNGTKLLIIFICLRVEYLPQGMQKDV